MAYLLAVPAGMGPSGVFASIAIAQAILALVSIVIFRKGTWKLKTI